MSSETTCCLKAEPVVQVSASVVKEQKKADLCCVQFFKQQFVFSFLEQLVYMYCLLCFLMIMGSFAGALPRGDITDASIWVLQHAADLTNLMNSIMLLETTTVATTVLSTTAVWTNK